MATYSELWEIRTNSPLRDKVAVAAVIKAQNLLDGATPSAGEVAWAEKAINNPVGVADALLNYVLAKNNAATVSQIVNASDATIQTNVDGAVDALIAGGA